MPIEREPRSNVSSEKVPESRVEANSSSDTSAAGAPGGESSKATAKIGDLGGGNVGKRGERSGDSRFGRGVDRSHVDVLREIVAPETPFACEKVTLLDELLDQGETDEERAARLPRMERCGQSYVTVGMGPSEGGPLFGAALEIGIIYTGDCVGVYASACAGLSTGPLGVGGAGPSTGWGRSKTPRVPGAVEVEVSDQVRQFHLAGVSTATADRWPGKPREMNSFGAGGGWSSVFERCHTVSVLETTARLFGSR